MLPAPEAGAALRLANEVSSFPRVVSVVGVLLRNLPGVRDRFSYRMNYFQCLNLKRYDVLIQTETGDPPSNSWSQLYRKGATHLPLARDGPLHSRN